MEILKLNKTIKALIMTVLWTVAILMIFCEGGTIAGQLMVKAGGFGLAWLLMRLMGVQS